VPGLEFAGEVDAVGEHVTSWKPGDRVFGIVAGGAYAEYVVAHERTLARVPKELSTVQAAAVPEAFMTAHDALFTLGGVRAGSNVLIHAVGSGVGIAAVQLARSTQARVFGTARTADKLARARDLGLEFPVEADAFDEQVAKIEPGGVDVVIDFVGGPYLAGNLKLLAPKGRLVVVGLMGGAREEIDLAAVLRKRLTIVGTVLRSRPLEEKIAVTQAFAREVVPLLARGVVSPVIDRVMSMTEIREAHALMASNSNFGKIVVSW
jgi:NADPH:quinone reductase-like Zn-dependent oxidoreductase